MYTIPRPLRASTSKDKIDAWQLFWLQRLIAKSYAHVPFVRERCKHAQVIPEDIVSLESLRLLPVNSKRDYQRKNISHYLSRLAKPDRLLIRSTSGSTGQRMQIRRSWYEERLLNMFFWKALHSYGFRPSHKLAVIDFREATADNDNQLLPNTLRQLGVYRRRVFNGLDDEHLLEKILAYKPDAISGMASAIAELADRAVAANISLSPGFIAPSGELLTQTLQQRISGLNTRIFNMFGCNEVNTIAWACPFGCSTFHVMDDALVVEILDDRDQPVASGEYGNVVVTSLFSYCMPIVRYRTGDIAIKGNARCDCGSDFSTITNIIGRTIDYFPLPDGERLHPWELLNTIRTNMHWINQFQLRQNSLQELELLVVPKVVQYDNNLRALEETAQQALINRIGIKVTCVDKIDDSGTSKKRLFKPLFEIS